MILTPANKSLCERVLNAFETGSAEGTTRQSRYIMTARTGFDR